MHMHMLGRSSKVVLILNYLKQIRVLFYTFVMICILSYFLLTIRVFKLLLTGRSEASASIFNQPNMEKRHYIFSNLKYSYNVSYTSS